MQSPEKSPPADAEASRDASSPRPAPPRRQLTWKGRLGLIAFSLLLMLAFEGFCRLIGFGGYPPLWKPVLSRGEEGTLYQTDPRALSPFFAVPVGGGVVTQGHMRYERVLMPKPEQTLRIGVVGESSVEGFPYPRNLTSVALLERYLQQYFPGRKIEALNLGATAIAGFPVRVVAGQSLDALDLDLLIVYTGHNEFYGAFGVASLQFAGRSVAAQQALYRLRSLAVYQALQALAARGAEWSASPEAETDRRVDLISEMARVDRIEPGGALHRRAAKNLTDNLDAMIGHARSRGVPVLLATLVGNESGMVPVRFYDADPERAEQIGKEARSLLMQPDLDPEAAIETLTARARAHPLHAMIPYVRGKFFERLDRNDRALQDFILARDLDAMPWRAPTLINDVIRTVARDRAVPLADAEAAFRREAGGAIGWKLMADHVHPSLDGQALLARTLVRSIVENELLGPPEREDLDLENIRIPFHVDAVALEQAQVYNTMIRLFEIPPMKKNNAHIAAYLRNKLDELMSGADEVQRRAWDRWLRERREAGEGVSISYLAGWEALDLGRPREASRYFAHSIGAMTPFGAARLRSQYLSLLAMRGADAFGEAQRALLARSLAEANFVELLTGSDNMPKFQATLGGLKILNGESREGVALVEQAAGRGFAIGATEKRLLEAVLADTAAP